jgi:hypothetical protein
MHGTYEERAGQARKIERTLMQGDARLCSSPFGRACKGLWPYKTAEELATRAKCGVRAAAYELSGDREPSGRSIAAVVAAISEWPLR